MKKIFFSAIVATVLVSSCKKEEIPSEEVYIGKVTINTITSVPGSTATGTFQITKNQISPVGTAQGYVKGSVVFSGLLSPADTAAFYGWGSDGVNRSYAFANKTATYSDIHAFENGTSGRFIINMPLTLEATIPLIANYGGNFVIGTPGNKIYCYLSDLTRVK